MTLFRLQVVSKPLCAPISHLHESAKTRHQPVLKLVLVTGCLLLVLTIGCGGDTPIEESNKITAPPDAPGGPTPNTPHTAAAPETSGRPDPPAQTEQNSPPAIPPTSATPAETPKTPTVKKDPTFTENPAERAARELEYLTKIAADRDATEPRLAFAEWLENYEPERAELIRLQIEIDSLPRIDPRLKELRHRASTLVEQLRTALSEPVASLISDGGRANIDDGYVWGVHCEDVTDAKLACLEAVPTLRYVTIQSGRITKVGAAHIAALPYPSSVTLREEVELADGAMEAFGNLVPWAEFHCYCKGIERDEIKALGERRIKHFEVLPSADKNLAARRFLRAVGSGSSPDKPIKTVDLSQVGISDSEMRFFTALPHVEEIYISESYDLTSKGLESLQHLKNLRRLELWETKVETLSPIFNHTSLRVLNVYPHYETVMGDAGMAGLEKLVNLEEMYLNDSGISAVTLKRLAPLTKLRKLELHVGKGIEQESDLGALSNLVALESLTLRDVEFGDEGLTHFANLKSLVTLDIRMSHGTGDGLKHLAGLPKLRYLLLSGETVTDAGIRHLAPVTSLRTLQAQQSKITPAGAAWLAGKLPGVTIILNEQVIKSARDNYTFQRRSFKNVASILVPTDWKDNSHGSTDSLRILEDGWEKIGAWSGDKASPAWIQLYVRNAKPQETAEQAVMESVNDGEILERKVLPFGSARLEKDRDVASCIYRNSDTQSLVCAGRIGDQMVLLWCHVHQSRFEEFRPLFVYVAQSVRLSDDAQQHVAEEVNVTSKELQRVASKVSPSKGDN